MKTLLLNLPCYKKLMRRYVASYFAPNFLLPPLELMSLGAIIREWKKGDVQLVDAVAEGKDRHVDAEGVAEFGSHGGVGAFPARRNLERAV